MTAAFVEFEMYSLTHSTNMYADLFWVLGPISKQNRQNNSYPGEVYILVMEKKYLLVGGEGWRRAENGSEVQGSAVSCNFN